tara:strand:- start:254 stop:1000 length:747 start_codon:yes stop_codon:yes gene_type:complete
MNDKGVFHNQTKKFGMDNTSGLWNTIELIDINQDGKMDFIAGNHGTNSFFENSMKMYINDFDENGSYEQIICLEREGKYFPILDKDELINQLPILKKNIVYYKDYANKSLNQIIDKTKLLESKVLQIDLLETSLFLNKETKFKQYSLPDEIQYSPIYSILNKKDTKTNKNSLYLGGNQYLVKPQFGSYDASKGWHISLSQNENNFFKSTPQSIGIKGQIRAIKALKNNQKEYLIFGINDKKIKFYELH